MSKGNEGEASLQTKKRKLNATYPVGTTSSSSSSGSSTESTSSNRYATFVAADNSDLQKLLITKGTINECSIRNAFKVDDQSKVNIYRMENGIKYGINTKQQANELVWFLHEDVEAYQYIVDWSPPLSRPGTPAAIIDAVNSDPPISTAIDRIGEVVYERCKKYLYFSKMVGIKDDNRFIEAKYDDGDNNKFLVTVITKDYAATAKHCLRKVSRNDELRDAEEGDHFEITSCEGEKTSTVEITYLSPDDSDFAILKVLRGSFDHAPILHSPSNGIRAACLGYPFFEEFKDGMLLDRQVPDKTPSVFPVEIAALNVTKSHLFAVSCGMTHGFSGAGLFRTYERNEFLLGICVRGRIPPADWTTNWQGPWLHRRSVAYFVPSEIIDSAIELIERPPMKHRRIY